MAVLCIRVNDKYVYAESFGANLKPNIDENETSYNNKYKRAISRFPPKLVFLIDLLVP